LDRFSVLSITHERHLAEITVVWRVCIDQSLHVSRVLRKLNTQPSFRSVQKKQWGWVHWRAMTWFYTVSLGWRIQCAISYVLKTLSSAKSKSDVKMHWSVSYNLVHSQLTHAGYLRCYICGGLRS
jgi:hypothetical protein